ncbi:MAG TPA: class I SAM-dependent methyltransferase [Nannocystaceae bacterium]|nr:class I SAM-dependent methyltransferase [Nannocystaceae bacterium]
MDRLRLPALCALLVLAGCRPEPGLPRHYDDPNAMIGEFEKEDRDAWSMPERVVRSLEIDSKEAVVADIGAGSGYFSRRLAREVPAGKVYAVDIDDTFHKYIEKNRESWGTPNIEPHLAFYDDPALPETSIDLVFMSNTYPYLRDRVAYLQRVRAALKPGGRLAIISYRVDANPPDPSAPEPKFRVSRDQTLAEADQAGFALDREETYLPHQFFLILKVK